jgi:hypothetical protein
MLRLRFRPLGIAGGHGTRPEPAISETLQGNCGTAASYCANWPRTPDRTSIGRESIDWLTDMSTARPKIANGPILPHPHRIDIHDMLPTPRPEPFERNASAITWLSGLQDHYQFSDLTNFRPRIKQLLTFY